MEAYVSDTFSPWDVLYFSEKEVGRRLVTTGMA